MPRSTASPYPQSILELATAFQRSQTLFTLVSLRIPTRLDGRERRLDDLAWEMRLHPFPLDRFVNACVALGLLERKRDRVRNSPLAQRFLVRGLPEYLGEVVHHHDRVTSERWRSLGSDLATWRPGTRGAGNHEKTATRPRKLRTDIASLHAHHNLNHVMGQSLAERYEFSKHEHMLDLGGGTGAVSIAICEKHPALSAMVVDLPAVTRHARAYIKRSGLTGRIRVRTGDLCRDPLPSGSDLALLSNVLSMMSVEEDRALMERVFDRLEPGGTLLVCGWMLDSRRLSPLLGVLFCLNDIAWQAPDVERSAATYARWLRSAGFKVDERRKVTPPWSLLVARKPV